MTKRDGMRFGWEADPTEHKRTYVKPNCSGISGDDPEPPWRSGPGKRMEIRIVGGRLEVVECESTPARDG